MRVTAMMFVRNGAEYLPRCLRHFAEQGVEVAVLDHGSTDATPEILRAHRGAPVLATRSLPYEGLFDLEQMLLIQREQARRIGADWYILAGVDEIMQSDRPGETLRDAIARVAAAGFDSINFNEFVFVYEDDAVSYVGTDYVETMRSYYHFAPQPIRLVRAFRAGLAVDNLESGGHLLPLDRIKLYTGTFALRHYITLGRAHAVAKYVGRKFAPKNLARGWHHNRVNLSAEQFAAPPAENLFRLANPSAPLDATRPFTTHFWQWERS